MHEMQTIVVDDPGVCLSHSFTVQTWLNRSMSCLGWRLLETQETLHEMCQQGGVCQVTVAS